jgi:hypothetical protein
MQPVLSVLRVDSAVVAVVEHTMLLRRQPPGMAELRAAVAAGCAPQRL